MDKFDGGVWVSTPRGFKVPSEFVLRYAGREALYEGDLAQGSPCQRRACE
jgi:hypothetical protein